MSAISGSVLSQDAEPLALFCSAVGEDLGSLAVLHDREPDEETIRTLHEIGFPSSLGLNLRSGHGHNAAELMRSALAELAENLSDDEIDALAVDYANIYLSYVYRASPYESVWRDDDGLERQRPMFEVRDWYRKHDLRAGDWARRADDHLVLQLEFLGFLLEQSKEPLLCEAADFMDQHLLLWIESFAARVASRCETPFFAGLAMVTSAYVQELRDILADITDRPRPAIETRSEGIKSTDSEEQLPPSYAPEAGPGW